MWRGTPGSPPAPCRTRSAASARSPRRPGSASRRPSASWATARTRAPPRRIAEQLLREQPALTGVVVHNEPLLEPLIDAFEQLGLRVPGDLSITAICPDELAASARVPVTSVALPSAEVGTRAVELLMEKL